MKNEYCDNYIKTATDQFGKSAVLALNKSRHETKPMYWVWVWVADLMHMSRLHFGLEDLVHAPYISSTTGTLNAVQSQNTGK